MGTVHSLAQQRGRHDDGRCHEPSCGGVYRVVCPYRGQHPLRCPHSHVEPSRRYLLWGFLEQYSPRRCRDCGQNLYDPASSKNLPS